MKCIMNNTFQNKRHVDSMTFINLKLAISRSQLDSYWGSITATLQFKRNVIFARKKKTTLFLDFSIVLPNSWIQFTVGMNIRRLTTSPHNNKHKQ